MGVKVSKSVCWNFEGKFIFCSKSDKWDIFGPRHTKAPKFHKIFSLDFSELLLDDRHSEKNASYFFCFSKQV